MKQVADTNKCVTVEKLQEYEVFGQKCQLCKPYVRRMLDTGEVEFFSIITDVEP